MNGKRSYRWQESERERQQNNDPVKPPLATFESLSSVKGYGTQVLHGLPRGVDGRLTARA